MLDTVNVSNPSFFFVHALQSCSHRNVCFWTLKALPELQTAAADVDVLPVNVGRLVRTGVKCVRACELARVCLCECFSSRPACGLSSQRVFAHNTKRFWIHAATDQVADYFRDYSCEQPPGSRAATTTAVVTAPSSERRIQLVTLRKSVLRPVSNPSYIRSVCAVQKTSYR